MIPTRVLELSRIASRDISRHAINTVAFLESGRAVATNGHALLDHRFPPNGDVPKGGFLLPVEDAKAALKAFRKCDAVSLEFTPGGATFSSESASLKVVAREAQYPGVDQVFPKGEAAFTITLDARALRDVLDAVVAISGASSSVEVPVRFTFRKPDGPVGIEATGMPHGETLAGLIMPLRDR